MKIFLLFWLILLIFLFPNVIALDCPIEGYQPTANIEITFDCYLPEGTYLCGNLTVKNDATMTLDPNAWLFIIDTLHIKPNSKIDDGNICVGCTYSPTSWITKIEPSFYSPLKGRNYTNQKKFTVFWDTISDNVDRFDIQYYVQNGTHKVKGWSNWISTSEKSKDFGPESPYFVEHGLTFWFRVREIYINGSKGLWSTQKGTTIDLKKPLCFIEDLPSTSYVNFNLNWEAVDIDSGIKSVEILYSTSDNPDDWNDISSLCSITDSSASCIGTPGITYNFKCRAIDYAGNIGDFSDIVTTTITNYVSSFIRQLPRWMSPHRLEWEEGRSFLISWGGAYKGIETKCYNIKWIKSDSPDFTNPNNWNDIKVSGDMCLPPNKTKEVFGDTETTIEDGKTYYFMIRAVNVFNEIEPWPDPNNPDDINRITYTTVDTIPPVVWDEIRDQDGNIIEGWEVPEGLEKVYIHGNAKDEISGVKNATVIRVYITESGFEREETKNCGPANPGEISSCTFEAFFGPDTQIKYRTEAFDNADNWNSSTKYATKWKFLTRHPIANFIVHHLFLSLGSHFDGKIQVRNLNNQPVNVTLTLSGYEFVKFLGMEGNYIIGNDGKEITIFDINPFEERYVEIEILSSDPGSYILKLDATNTIGETDYDEMHISINFRPGFSGLTDWAVILLIFIACIFVYVRLNPM